MDPMAEESLDATVRAWGNSYGIVIPADVARRLHLRAGEPVHVRLRYEPGSNQASQLPSWDLATDYDIDAIMDEEAGA